MVSDIARGDSMSFGKFNCSKGFSNSYLIKQSEITKSFSHIEIHVNLDCINEPSRERSHIMSSIFKSSQDHRII
jgi:hypothetical protein